MNKSARLFALLLALVTACQAPAERYFRYATLNSDDIEGMPAQDIHRIKANLYRVGGNLALGVVYREAAAAPSNEAVRMDSLGTLLFDLGTYQLPIDTASYHWILPDLVAGDNNRVYAFPRRYHLPTIKMLHLNPTTLILCDSDATYLKDADTVYCIPSDSYLQVEPGDFSTEQVEGVTYGRDSATYYYWDEPTPPPHQP